MIDQKGTELLLGKTIISATILGCEYEIGWGEYKYPCDGENVLELKFRDGTGVKIIGGYSGYSGKSCDEYVEVLNIKPIEKELGR